MQQGTIGSRKRKNAGGKSHHTATLRKVSAPIRATPQKAWRTVGDITSMPAWAPGVSKVHITSQRRRGIGAVRDVVFEDGRRIEEHVTSWDAGIGFTYVATEGLPLRAYVATISIRPSGKDRVRITWQSYLNSIAMTESEFGGLLAEMGTFYEESLANLKDVLSRGKKERR